MNLHKLKCFSVLAEELHFSRAAAKLYMAQPPLSRTIRELEGELKVTLFVRHSRKVELTKAGAYLKEETGKLFTHLQQITEQLDVLENGSSGTLRIGYVGAAMHSVLPAILVALKKSLNIKVVLSELKNEQQVDALYLGQIDMGFVRSVPAGKDILFLKVFSEPFALILAKNHRLSQQKRISLKALADEPFIGLSYDCAPKLNDAIQNVCLEAGFSPKIAHETSQINSIVRLVESGLGYSIVPLSVQNAYALQVKFVELSKYKPQAHLFLMHRTPVDPLVKRCVLVIREELSNL